MRVVHAEPHERRAVEARVEAWWQAFSDRHRALEARFRGEAEWDLAGWMRQTLSAVHPDLMWEFGPAVDGPGHRLVITPEDRHELRPLVEVLLRCAPPLEGWQFYDGRLPEDVESARQMVEARCGRPSRLESVEVVRGEHRKVDLVFRGPAVRNEDDRSALDEAFVLTEVLLGEHVLNRWIGEIAVRPVRRGLLRLLRRDTAAVTPLEGARAAVHGLIDTVQVERPGAPWIDRREHESWSTLKLEPDAADEYAEQDDLFVAITPDVELWRARRADCFAGERFSAHGERFCYLKLDGVDGLDGSRFADRMGIEDALDAALLPERLGCTVGGGTGRRYSYVELALLDPQRALPVCRRVLAEGGLPRRSWILFHEPEWAAEWIGVHADSPPPPLPDFD